MNTLALSTPDQSGIGWDLLIDQSGNLVVATGGTALAQDVASAVRTFRGEAWYDITLGVPYYENIFGQRISLQYLKQAFIAAGMIVPNVAQIKVFFIGPTSSRTIGGQLQIFSADGLVAVVLTGNLFGVAPWWVSGASEEAVGATT